LGRAKKIQFSEHRRACERVTEEEIVKKRIGKKKEWRRNEVGITGREVE